MARSSRSRSRSKSKKTSRGQNCPSGQIYRAPYTRYRGDQEIKVSGNCIRSVSQSKQKRSVQDQQYLAERAKIQRKASRMFSREASQKCPPGKVLREGFYRKPAHRKSYKRSSGTNIAATEVKGAWVPPTCVPSINRQKKQRLFVLERGVLKKYGYTDIHDLTTEERHDALDKALKEIEPLPLLRRVNALYVLNKNKDPELAEKFHEDVEYIRETPTYQNRPTAKSSRKSSSKNSKSSKKRRQKRYHQTSESF